ncbi:unnamed protein product [Polarella glacialis]|uniref:Uncharacterized protein n=1 Tax=Polarella glacialis TaxID=89957 RepID=A0A813GIL9_POLGL|nr:unnamed protein product [Polarella glacialis]
MGTREMQHGLVPVSSDGEGHSSGEDTELEFDSYYDDWDGEINATMVDFKQPRGCKPVCSGACCCHFCYVVLFLCLMVIFPLWAKWLVTNPMPVQYWHENFPPFPTISALGGQQLAREALPKIAMSPLPTSPSSCNYSCSAWHGYRTAEMNFEVSLTLDSPRLSKAYAHTVYPVLFASADFSDWWVVGDRRHAYPSPFWRARSAQAGHEHVYVTDACTRPPHAGLKEPTSATYALACVIWSPLAFEKMQALSEVTDAELGALCNSVGGVCGWSCNSEIPPDRLPGCSADGQIKVTPTTLAGRAITGAKFEGKIQMSECMGEDADGECITSTKSFSQWNCHQCEYSPVAEDEDMRRRLQIPGMGPMPGGGMPGFTDPDGGAPGGLPGMPMPGFADPDATGAGDGAGDGDGDGGAGAAGPTIYTSLPKFQVKVDGVDVPTGTDVFSEPRTFILTASVGPGSTWSKLYMEPTVKTPPPVPLNSVGKPLVKPDLDKDPDMLPLEDSSSKHAMRLNQQNTLTIKPSWCFGEQGPLYLVACAVNSTTYDSKDFKQFKPGQSVAPPPFNDRCIAVSGRCAQACQTEQHEMANCSLDGDIPMEYLVGAIHDEKNQTTPVWLFVYVLLIGFCVKVVMLCPGIFSSYPHCHRYSHELTQHLRYIVVCIPSAGENKATVLRNLVGAIGCMPRDCQCRYHVAFVDEGHRNEQKIMWQKLGNVIATIPDFGENTYEENAMQFFQMWTEETKKMDRGMIRDSSSEAMEPDILERMSGRTALSKLKRESGWSAMDPKSLMLLEAAIDVLEADVDDRKSSRLNLHKDDYADWEPKDRNCIPLRMHYLARARPIEDERTIKAQHVAPGTWYYKVPTVLDNTQWLRHRAQAHEMVYGLQDQDPTMHNVPLRTSRGKAGGLNFAENYLSILAERSDNLYGDARDHAPCLFSIADARHQFQQDFFHTTIPYFFTEEEELCEYVAFTQCPQYFHEMQDKLDYLDNNNAQFFRLNCMIRNCCGGVSSCGTNGTWMIKHKEGAVVWEKEQRRVRDQASGKKSMQVIERRIFHESCKVEDTASSLQQVLLGRRSQFINRRLSYGMAKNPTDYLAAVQRWAEGGVVLSLQTFLSCNNGVYMVWFTWIFFLCFIASLFRLVNKTDTTLLIVHYGILEQSDVDIVLNPVVHWTGAALKGLYGDYYLEHPDLVKDYVMMTFLFVVWIACLALILFGIFLFTEVLKCCTRRCGLRFCCVFPNEMRWWGRLLISMDNLTYFFWFWTAFFWIGFNYYSVFTVRSYHFSSTGMFAFMFIVQVISWGLIISASMRSTLSTSMEANEVIMLTMDNIWRSTQLFYITAPLLMYSLIKGTQDYTRYQFYGEDISFWTGGDRGEMSKNLVKWWTLFLIIGAVVAWVYYAAVGWKEQGTLSPCIIVTMIALDVLHPCTYLWVGQTKMTQEEANNMTWGQALSSRGWWERRIYSLILNQFLTGLLKWLGPAWFVAMPFATLFMPYIGVNQAFMMIGVPSNR